MSNNPVVDAVSKGQALERLNQTIQQYVDLKAQLTKMYVENFSKLSVYDEKLKNAKEEFSKKYFTKKANRYRTNSVAILEKMELADESIQRMTALKEKVLTVENPIESNET